MEKVKVLSKEYVKEKKEALNKLQDALANFSESINELASNYSEDYIWERIVKEGLYINIPYDKYEMNNHTYHIRILPEPEI